MTASLKTKLTTSRGRNKAPRSGRPSASQTLVLDQHLLDVAEDMFLSAGYEASSVDRLAIAARVSKNTIYRRYEGKEALFIAVTERAIKRLLHDSDIRISGVTVDDRMEQLALNVVNQSLRPQLVSLVRVVIPEAHRFGELARTLDRSGRLAVIAFISRFLKSEAEIGNLDLVSPTDVAAEKFLQLTGGSLLLRALMGADIDQLTKEAPAVVKSGVALFLRSCRASSTKPSERRKGKQISIRPSVRGQII